MKESRSAADAGAADLAADAVVDAAGSAGDVEEPVEPMQLRAESLLAEPTQAADLADAAVAVDAVCLAARAV